MRSRRHDSDSDSVPDCEDACPTIPRRECRACGCGVADTDSDSDGVPTVKTLVPTIRRRQSRVYAVAASRIPTPTVTVARNVMDCDDGDGSIRPGAEELCNDVDDNCDGVVDEGCECGPDAIPGDLDSDCDVDRDDVMIILSYRNQPASANPDCDLDGDGRITVLDARNVSSCAPAPGASAPDPRRSETPLTGRSCRTWES